MIANLLMLTLLLFVIFLYFRNNPMGYDKKYRMRCFLNWFPLGMTYAFLYMGRYNLTVAKNAFGTLMTKEDFGVIFAAGTITYAFSFLINGPLTDRIGGRKAILIGAAGACIMNIALGVTTYMILAENYDINLTLVFAVLYSLNMYFQSYGAVAIVKVNAHWFHIRERGIFGGIFGTLISLGIYFAFDWGFAIVEATKASAKNLGFFQELLRSMLMANGNTVDATWYVFFVPAAILAIFVVIDIFMVKDTPKEAGLEDLETGDASEGEMDVNYSGMEIIKKILTNPIILTVAFIEFCSGVLRNGIMHWYTFYSKEVLVKQLGLAGTPALFFKDNWGLLLCFAGVLGGFFAGTVSDKLFQSRRGPSVAMMYALMILGVIIMFFALQTESYILLGANAIFMSLCVIGVHGLLSGTATMDFGGRKGAATAVGVIDGFVYLGTGVQSLALGYLTTKSWTYWPIFLFPFSIIGVLLAIKIWKAFPTAVRKGVK